MTVRLVNIESPHARCSYKLWGSVAASHARPLAAMRSVNAPSPQPRSSMVSSGFGARRSRPSAPRSETKRALRSYPAASHACAPPQNWPYRGRHKKQTAPREAVCLCRRPGRLYCGEQNPTPMPCPSGVHPSASICANSLASVMSRWLGAPPMPLLYRR
jgi:hypothetical protein